MQIFNNLKGLSNWKTSKVEEMIDTFQDCKSICSFEPIREWKLPNIKKRTLV